MVWNEKKYFFTFARSFIWVIEIYSKVEMSEKMVMSYCFFYKLKTTFLFVMIFGYKLRHFSWSILKISLLAKFIILSGKFWMSETHQSFYKWFYENKFLWQVGQFKWGLFARLFYEQA